MKRMQSLVMAMAAAVCAGCSDTEKITLNGAGASFPAPVYQNWTYHYTQSASGVKVNYQSLGSGAGVNQIKAGTVDFAGTDSPLTAAELEEAGLVQFPMLSGGVAVIVNIPGVGNHQLKLSRENLAGIFLGKITRWNDPRLLRDNPALPDLPVTVVRRADGSGTTFIFTNYLSKISDEWRTVAGCGAAVKWPVGIGGQKNPGVCNSVAKISGAIGYTEYTYAAEAELPMAQLENSAGNFIAPTLESFIAGVAAADWRNAPDLCLILTDQPGERSYPILGVTYILFRKDAPAGRREELFKFFNWCLSSGAAAARKMQYVPLPENVTAIIQNGVLK